MPADIYETSTETLFLGKQDAMQRQTLVPLHHHMRTQAPGGAGMKCLEVACGTGRFATFIKVGYSAGERVNSAIGRLDVWQCHVFMLVPDSRHLVHLYIFDRTTTPRWT